MNIADFQKEVRPGSTVNINRQPYKMSQVLECEKGDGKKLFKVFLEGDRLLLADADLERYALMSATVAPFGFPLSDRLFFQGKEYEATSGDALKVEVVFGDGEYKEGDSETYWDYTEGEDEILRIAKDANGNRMDRVGRFIPTDWVQL